MIRYSLRCESAHDFESWFASASAYDALAGAGHLSCPVCGSAKVAKSLMVPSVASGREAGDKPLSAPASKAEQDIAELRRKIEENSENVGLKFAAEARAIHEGEAPRRSIHGEARADEAKKLIEDGIPVLPLPFIRSSRSN